MKCHIVQLIRGVRDLLISYLEKQPQSDKGQYFRQGLWTKMLRFHMIQTYCFTGGQERSKQDISLVWNFSNRLIFLEGSACLCLTPTWDLIVCYSFIYFCVGMGVSLWVFVCHSTCIGIRGQLTGVRVVGAGSVVLEIKLRSSCLQMKNFID